MRQDVLDQAFFRTAMLADALAETVAELRLIDPGDMIGYIRGQKWAAISDLVQSSTELSFCEGTMSFACTADFEIGWTTPPSISLDLEFQTPAVSAFFTLVLGRRESVVEMKNMWFACPPSSEAIGTRIFAQALADARSPYRRARAAR